MTRKKINWTKTVGTVRILFIEKVPCTSTNKILETIVQPVQKTDDMSVNTLSLTLTVSKSKLSFVIDVMEKPSCKVNLGTVNN